MYYTVHSITQAVCKQGRMVKNYGTIKKTTEQE